MKKPEVTFVMKLVSTICACLLFIAVFNLPIEYYNLLRLVIFIGALLVIFPLNAKRLLWIILFTIIAFLFNPIIPIYLYVKTYWLPIDIISGILFLIISFFPESPKKTNNINEKNKKVYSRDRIY